MGFQNTAVSGTVSLSAGSTVNISGTPTVEIAGTPAVTVASGSVVVSVAAGDSLAVNITGTPNVAISGTPTVNIAGTVDANISAGTVQVENVTGGVLVSEATAPQQLLASEAGTSTSASVTLPTNCESIAVLVPSATWTGTVKVTGNTTGMSYPVGSVSAIAGGGDELQVANVFPAVDDAVTITLSSAPGVPWYVTSDSVVRYSFGAVAGGGSPLASPAIAGVVAKPFNYPNNTAGVSLQLQGVASGSPIIVIAADVLYNTSGAGFSGISDTFATPYTWTLIDGTWNSALVANDFFLGAWIGQGGKGTSGTITLPSTDSASFGGIAIPLQGASTAAGLGALDGHGAANGTTTAPQRIPSASGELAIFYGGTNFTAYGGNAYPTTLPGQPYGNVLVDAAGYSDVPLCVAVLPNVQLGNGYQPAWAWNGETAGYAITGSLLVKAA